MHPPCARPGGLRTAGTLLLLSAGCCVAPPTPRELLELGLRSPEQTLRTFQTAVRADEPEAQRRCFSARFLAENRLSSLVWREYWEELERSQPLLRRALVDARIEGGIEVRGGRARGEARSHGRRILLEFAREDFGEAWEGATLAFDETAPFDERTGVQEGADGRRWLWARVTLPPGREAESITEVRVGREWKIDAFELLEGPPRRSTE